MIMKRIAKLTALALPMGMILLGAGCHKSSEQAALDASQVPGAVSQAFAQTTGDTKQNADSAMAALQAKDSPGAFVQLCQISDNPNLTSEQRAVIAQAKQAVFKQVAADAQNGNASAQAVVHRYMSTR
jgi:hypothetical protein